MGLHFGNLWKYFGVVTYRLSPFEQKALKGIIDPGFLNTCRRFAENVPYIGPRNYQIPFLLFNASPEDNIFIVFIFFRLAALLAYLTYEWGEHANHLTHRKNPADYENDV